MYLIADKLTGNSPCFFGRKIHPQQIFPVGPWEIYLEIASSKMNRLEAHTGFFRLLMKGTKPPVNLTISTKRLSPQL